MKSEKQRLSIQEYANLIGLTRQAILYRITNGLELPNVKSFEKIGKAYIITMSNNKQKKNDYEPKNKGVRSSTPPNG